MALHEQHSIRAQGRGGPAPIGRLAGRRIEHEHEPEGQEGNGPHEPPLQLVVDICAEDEHEGGSGSAGDPQASLCPVCSHALPDDNVAINEHLDSCLRIPTASSGEPSKRARTIGYFFQRPAP